MLNYAYKLRSFMNSLSLYQQKILYRFMKQKNNNKMINLNILLFKIQKLFI